MVHCYKLGKIDFRFRPVITHFIFTVQLEMQIVIQEKNLLTDVFQTSLVGALVKLS